MEYLIQLSVFAFGFSYLLFHSESMKCGVSKMGCTNSYEDKLATMFTKITYKCPCGHSVIISHQKSFVICTWCGNKVYKDDKEEFKDRLMKSIRRLKKERRK